jgi:hypothetical protein
LTDIPLLPLEDSRWATYRGGYGGVLYNAVPIIQRLQSEGATEEFWEHVWAELHHQGDVGEATYALVPYLVDYQSRQSELDEQLFHFCVLVDLQQTENNNPAIPSEIEFSYMRALRALPVIGAERLKRGVAEHVVMGVTAAIALAAGHRVLARAYLEFGRDDALTYLKDLCGFEPGRDD